MQLWSRRKYVLNKELEDGNSRDTAIKATFTLYSVELPDIADEG